MPKAKWMLILLAAASVPAGCGNPQRDARQKLSDQIDEARRLYSHASAELARPPYIDNVTGQSQVTAETVVRMGGTRLDGQVERLAGGVRVTPRDRGAPVEVPYADIRAIEAYKVPAPDLSASSQPAAEAIARPLGLLDQAAKTVGDALDAAVKADPKLDAGARGDAHLLLGEIAYLRGQVHANRAEEVRSSLARLRRDAEDLSATVRTHAMQADIQSKLAGLSRDEVNKLKKQVSDETAQVQGKLAAINGEVAKNEKDIQDLAAANESQLKESRALRDKSEASGGVKALKEAQAIETGVWANEAKINALEDKNASLKVDKELLDQQAAGLKARADAIDRHLANMDQRGQTFKDAQAKAQQAAGEQFDKLAETLNQVVATAARLAEDRTKALEAMRASAGHLDDAAKLLGEERTAAVQRQAQLGREGKQPNQIVETLADDAHLVSAIALRAAAHQGVADIRAGQIATDQTNARLEAAVGTLAQKAAKPAPPAAKSLAADPKAVADATDEATKSYALAEKDLDTILSGHLKAEPLSHTKWIYQAKLADTYMAHYQLTPADMNLRDKAAGFVKEALAGKEQSPNLDAVRNLQRLIDRAGQTPAAPPPAPPATPPPAAPTTAPAAGS